MATRKTGSELSECTQISRRQAARINLLLGYGRYAVFILNQLILVPIYLRFIGIETYGAWLASGNLVTVLNVLDMGFILIVTQRLATAFGAGDDSRFVREAGSSLGIIAAAFLFLVIVTSSLSPWIPGWINAPASQSRALRSAIVLAGIGAAIEIIAFSMWSVLQAWQFAFLCEFNLLIGAILGLAATVLFLIKGYGVIAFGIGAVVKAGAAALLLGCVVAFQWRRRKLALPTITLHESSQLLRYSFPVIVSRFMLSLVDNGQPVIVSACIGPVPAAILSLTSRIFTGCRRLLDPITGSTFAGVAQLVGQSDSHSARVRGVLHELFTIMLASAGVMFSAAVALNVSFGRLWVGPQRFGNVTLTIVVCVAALVLFVNASQGTILTALGNVRGPAWATLCEAIVRVPLAVALLLWLGILGAPLAAIISSLAVESWYLFRLFSRELSLRWREAIQVVGSGLIGLITCLSIGAGIAILLRPATNWSVLIARAICITLALAVVMLWLNPLARNKVQRAALYVLFRRKIDA